MLLGASHRGCPIMEVAMFRAISVVFSGMGTLILLLSIVFWLGDEWTWLLDFFLQLQGG